MLQGMSNIDTYTHIHHMTTLQLHIHPSHDAGRESQSLIKVVVVKLCNPSFIAAAFTLEWEAELCNSVVNYKQCHNSAVILSS